MQRHSLGAILACFAVIGALPAHAEDRCSGVAITEVRSLKALPNQLRHLLPSATSGQDGIADRGGRFNVTDVTDHELPMRRFVLAAVGASCAVIAVEYGGRAHGFELTEYRLTDEAWKATQHRTVLGEPKSTKDLLTFRCRIAATRGWQQRVERTHSPPISGRQQAPGGVPRI
jgi:hypothetical protein